MSTTVFVCADAPAIPYNGTDVVAIKELCARPAQIASDLGEVASVVLVLHHSGYDFAEVQKALRSVEIDPLGAQIFDVPGGIGSVDLEIAISGLRSRALAFAGSSPEQAKPVLRGEVTRRGLFRPPEPIYLAAPMVDHGVCAAADGCRACVDVCPQDAYRWHQGRIHFNKNICEPCGRCIAGCPTEAISNAASTPAMLAAQVTALVDHGDTAIGLRFVCSRTKLSEPLSGWYDVTVPCTGMIPGSWLITALLMGAGAVAVVSCSDSGCPLALDEHSRSAIDFARTILAAASLDPESVPTEAGAGTIKDSVATRDFANPFTHAGVVETMLALDSFSESAVVVTHPGATVGVVDIDPHACTLCTQCAQTCPTDAILAEYNGEVVSLTFDPASCTNCLQCTIACPEIERGAISVKSRVDTDLLRTGRFSVNQGVVLVCDSCGKPIAPSPMMDRIGELLGDRFNDTMSYLTRKCVDCRGLT